MKGKRGVKRRRRRWREACFLGGNQLFGIQSIQSISRPASALQPRKMCPAIETALTYALGITWAFSCLFLSFWLAGNMTRNSQGEIIITFLVQDRHMYACKPCVRKMPAWGSLETPKREDARSSRLQQRHGGPQGRYLSGSPPSPRLDPLAA